MEVTSIIKYHDDDADRSLFHNPVRRTSIITYDDVEDDEPAEAPKKDPSPPKPAQGQPPQKEVKGEKLEN